MSVNRSSLEDVLREFEQALGARSPRTVFYANAYAITSAEENDALADAFEHADVVFCDGFGAYIASRLLGEPVRERFAIPDWIDRLAQLCVRRRQSMFLLGAEPGVADKAAATLRARNEGLLVFSHHGYFRKDDAQSAAVIGEINRSGASVLLVGFGMPAQELWITSNRQFLNPVVVMSVGATFDYVAGHIKRGPRWMTDHGLEWLSRLVIEPRRLWKRYLLGLPQFASIVLKQRSLPRSARSES